MSYKQRSEILIRRSDHCVTWKIGQTWEHLWPDVSKLPQPAELVDIELSGDGNVVTLVFREETVHNAGG